MGNSPWPIDLYQNGLHGFQVKNMVDSWVDMELKQSRVPPGSNRTSGSHEIDDKI